MTRKAHSVKRRERKARLAAAEAQRAAEAQPTPAFIARRSSGRGRLPFSRSSIDGLPGPVRIRQIDIEPAANEGAPDASIARAVLHPQR